MILSWKVVAAWSKVLRHSSEQRVRHCGELCKWSLIKCSCTRVDKCRGVSLTYGAHEGRGFHPKHIAYFKRWKKTNFIISLSDRGRALITGEREVPIDNPWTRWAGKRFFYGFQWLSWYLRGQPTMRCWLCRIYQQECEWDLVCKDKV